MRILVVDNVIERLDTLTEILRELFPNAQIKSEKDPIEAAKYCLFHAVDLVFTELEPGRMDALQLEGLIHNMNPKAKVYITGKLQSLYSWEIIDENGVLAEDGICGVITYPIIPEKIQTLFNEQIKTGDKS